MVSGRTSKSKRSGRWGGGGGGGRQLVKYGCFLFLLYYHINLLCHAAFLHSIPMPTEISY